MSLRIVPIAFMVLLSSITLASISASAEEEPNDSLLDPEVITPGTYDGTVVSGKDIDVYRMDMADDTILFISLEKTDELFGSINMDTYDEYRGKVYEPSFHIETPGETLREYIPVQNSTTYYFEVFGNGSYSFRTYTIERDLNEEASEIEKGSISGSVGTMSWEGLEVEDEDHFVYYPDGSTDFTLTKDDAGPGTIKMTIELGYGDYKEIEVVGEGDSETVTVTTWDYYFDYVEIYIEGDGNYTLEVARTNPFEGLDQFLCCFVVLIFVSLLAFLVVIVLVVVFVVRATRSKDGKGAPPSDLPPSMRPPRTARTPPPPPDQSARP